MPDLQALAATDDDDGALQGGVLPAAGRDEDPALGVQLRVEGAAEDAPADAPSLDLVGSAALHEGSPALIALLGVYFDAAVEAFGQDDALREGIPVAGRERDPTAVVDGVLIAAAKYQGGPLRPWWRWSRGSSPLSPKGPHILPSAARLSSTLSIFFSLKVSRSSRVDQSS